MEEKKQEKKETPEKEVKELPGWFEPLLAEGVTSASTSDYLFTVETSRYKGNKVALMKGQAKRAIAILKRVAEHEFPGLDYEIDDHDVPWTTFFRITARGGLRVARVYYVYMLVTDWIGIYSDKVLEENARKALYSLLLQGDA